MVAMEIGKRHYLSYYSNSSKQDKILQKKNESHTFKLQLIKLSWLDKNYVRKNVATLKRYVFRKRAQKLIFCFAFHDWLPHF